MTASRRLLCAALVVIFVAFTLLASLPVSDTRALRSEPMGQHHIALHVAHKVVTSTCLKLKPHQPYALVPTHEKPVPACGMTAYAGIQALLCVHTDSILELSINNPRLAPPSRA